MTFALIGAATALLIWPHPALDARRIRALQAVRRLAPVHQSGRSDSTHSRSFERARPGFIALIVIATAAVVAPGLGAVAAAEFALGLLAVLATARAAYRQAKAGRRRRARDQQMALALAVLVGELEAGSAVSTALAAAGDVGGEIGRRLDEASIGDDALARVIVAWRSSTTTGVPLVDLLTRVRSDLGAAMSTRREVQAAVAGPQATAAVLALLPVLGVALGAAIGANPVAVLFATPVGRALLCLGVLLDAGGVRWTQRLIARAQR